MLAIAHRSQVQRAALQPLAAPIEPSREEIAPQPDAAFRNRRTRVAFSRIFCCAGETAHQPFVCRFERAHDAAVTHAQQPQRARRFLAEDVTGGSGRDAFACEEYDAANAFGWKPGEGPSVSAWQPLPARQSTAQPRSVRTPGAYRPSNWTPLTASTVCDRLVLSISMSNSFQEQEEAAPAPAIDGAVRAAVRGAAPVCRPGGY